MENARPNTDASARGRPNDGRSLRSWPGSAAQRFAAAPVRRSAWAYDTRTSRWAGLRSRMPPYLIAEPGARVTAVAASPADARRLAVLTNATQAPAGRPSKIARQAP